MLFYLMLRKNSEIRKAICMIYNLCLIIVKRQKYIFSFMRCEAVFASMTWAQFHNLT